HHGEKRTQHGLRLGIPVLLDHAGYLIHERIQLPRQPKRLVLRKPAARCELGGESYGIGGRGSRKTWPQPAQRVGVMALSGGVPHGVGPFSFARCSREDLVASPS